MEFNGLPLHPLVVHAVVILGPLAAVTALAYAVVPRWRWLLRWPMVFLAAVTAGATYVAKIAGEDLFDDRFLGLDEGPLADQIALHEERGELLVWFALGFLVLALLAAWTLGGPSALASGKGARDSKGAASVVVAVLVAAGAVALVVMIFLTGDAGSRAVWEQVDALGRVSAQ